MRFLVDECTGPKVAKWLRARGHDVFSAYDQARGQSDDELLRKAVEGSRILITNDRDFGMKRYRDGRSHCGVVFLRLTDERAICKIAVLGRLLDAHQHELSNHFVVASEDRIRFSRA